MTNSNGTTQKPLRVGVFFEGIQYADIACLDVLGNLSVPVVSSYAEGMEFARALLPKAREMEFFYFASSMDPKKCAPVTPNIYIIPTHTYEDAPTDLDILLVGGPDPTKLPPSSFPYLQKAIKTVPLIMSVCTGGAWLAAAGVLEGKKATTNRGVIPLAKQLAPNVDWQDQRWVIEKGHFDGAEIWTSGGALCGIDMMVHYARQTFDSDLVEALGVESLAFNPKGPRGQYYEDDAAAKA